MARVDARAQSPTFTLLPAYLQTFNLPQPMHTLDVHTPAISTQQGRDPTVAEPWPLQRQPIHVLNQLPLIRRKVLPVSLAGPGLADGPTDPTLRMPQPTAEMFHRPASAGRGQEFFESYAIASFMISMSIR